MAIFWIEVWLKYQKESLTGLYSSEVNGVLYYEIGSWCEHYNPYCIRGTEVSKNLGGYAIHNPSLLSTTSYCGPTAIQENISLCPELDNIWEIFSKFHACTIYSILCAIQTINVKKSLLLILSIIILCFLH